jgi:POT family proton-dependent oligopeptide transporter
MASGNVDGSIQVEKAREPKPGLVAFLKQHPVGFWFIFWGEFAERCSFYGSRAILGLYIAEELGFGQDNSARFLSLFFAACYFLPLVGGYLADNFFGKYRTIVWFSLPYIIGQCMLAVKSPVFLLISLCLLAMGSGVIKPNLSTLMGLTYDQQRPGQTQLRSTAFSMFYMAINIGAALSQFFLPWIKNTMGYSVAFMFPAGLMAVAFLIFAAGKRFYGHEVIARKHRTPEERQMQWQVLKRILGLFLLVMFFWAIFDQSSSTWIFFANSYMDWEALPGVTILPEQMQAINPVLIVLCLPLVTYFWVALDRRGISVRATDKMLIGFLLTAACMGIMGYAGLRAGSSETLLAPSPPGQAVGQGSRDRTKELKPFLDAGSVAALGQPFPPMSYVVTNAVLPERMTRSYVRHENKVTIRWQMLAYFLMTLAEILISVTGLELAFVAAPKSMKSFVTSIWLLTVFMGNLLINYTISPFYPDMNPGTYFLMFAGMMMAVVVAFVPVARRFNRIVAAEAEAGIS